MSNGVGDSAAAMRDLIDRYRDAALTSAGHQTVTLGDHPVVWWFNLANATTLQLMTALAADSRLVTPGHPELSLLVTRYLKPTRPMGGRLASDRVIIEQWITDGASVPAEVLSQPGSDAALIAPDSASAATGVAALDSPPLPDPIWTREEVMKREPLYFHRLANIETNADFLPEARRLAEFYLARGAQESDDDAYSPFPYSPATLDSRLDAIYKAFVDDMYKPHWFDTGILRFEGKRYPIGRVSNALVRERLFQRAPFNLTDGAWLQNIIRAGPMDEIRSRLFAIWSDEVGNGVVSQSHANVYETLLRSLNIYLPPITSPEFIEEDFLPSAFTAAVFQMAVGQFPEDYFPELLGMTLFLEWEATPTLTPTARMYAGRNINPHFYQLHVAIDNISVGHGALARESVHAYLADIQESGGDDLVQEHWKRVWNGYVTWATIGDFGRELTERMLMIERKQINISADPDVRECWPDSSGYAHRRMIRLVQRKAPYAIQVHAGKTVAGQSLTELFMQPERLLKALVDAKYVDPDSPRDSKFLELLSFNGPMYKVFTEAEVDTLLDWVESLRPRLGNCVDPLPDVPTPGGLPEKVVEIIAAHADLAAFAHDGITLTGPNGPLALSELVRTPRDAMAALIQSGWVVPREPDRSMFVTRLLSNGGPMAPPVFTAEEVQIISQWIGEGAALPAMATDVHLLAADLDEGALEAAEEKGTRDLSAHSFAARRKLIGMGSVH